MIFCITSKKIEIDGNSSIDYGKNKEKNHSNKNIILFRKILLMYFYIIMQNRFQSADMSIKQ